MQFRPFQWLVEIPKDKKKHLVVGTCIFLGSVAILSFVFPIFPQLWLFRAAYVGLLIAAAIWEIGQKITGKGKAEWMDFVWSIAGATVIMIISEIVNW